MKSSGSCWRRLLEILPLESLHFFALGFDTLPYKGKVGGDLSKAYLLPSLSTFFEDDSFAKVFLGWDESGIFCEVHADVKKVQVFFPDFRKGDSVELFIDTRDMKNVAYSHKFCHHFVFLPTPFDNDGEKIQGKEITRFRGDESHELADPSLFVLNSEDLARKGYILKIFIPSAALFGFDPLNFNHMGFTYRINRSYGPPQYFSASGEECNIEQNPSLWASSNLRG